MSTKNPINESDIATAAARVLHESFLEAARNGTVLYVENDALMRKAPNCKPILVKHLSGRNPETAKKFSGRKTFGGVSKSMLKQSRLNFDKIEKCE